MATPFPLCDLPVQLRFACSQEADTGYRPPTVSRTKIPPNWVPGAHGASSTDVKCGRLDHFIHRSQFHMKHHF